MECKNHTGKPAVNTCSKCGDWLCEDCSIEINGRLYCKSCLSKKVSEEPILSMTPPPPIPMGGYGHIEPRTMRKRPISSFFTFCCAFIPGCGQMYLGLMKRGFSLMAAFFGLIYLIQISWAFSFAVITLWFFSFFDTFLYKNKILNGEYVKDDIDDIKSFCSKNKTVILVALIVVLFSEIFRNVRFFLYNGFGSHQMPTLVIGAVLICLGLAVIFDKNKKPHKEKMKENE